MFDALLAGEFGHVNQAVNAFLHFDKCAELRQPRDLAFDDFARWIPEGKVTRLAKFGAFVEVEEGIDGLVHVSEFTNEKRIGHPSEVVKVGQVVRAVILSADPETKRLKLGMKQLEATSAGLFAQEATVC